MRRFPRRPQKQSAVIIPTRPPFKGLADVFPLAAMPPEYAVIFDNFVARQDGPSLRQGSRLHVTGFDYPIEAPVTSFLIFNGRVPADNKLFAVAGGGIYDVTTPGAVGPALQSGLSTTNVRWQYAQQTYTTANNTYMVAVNGVDAPRLYNGSWSTASQTSSPSNPGEFKDKDSAGNDVNIAQFNDVVTHQQRLWFVANSSTKGYYCDIATVGGDLHPFDFGPFFTRGGQLHKLATWTMDAGGDSGVAAVLVAISSVGDVVVFDGNDPSDAEAWRYRATYQLGSPMGKNCTKSFGGDLLYHSVDGVYRLSTYTKTGRGDADSAMTYLISTSLATFARTFRTTDGWEMVSFPTQNVFLINVPQVSASQNFQYVLHNTTGGWSRFIGWPARCFAEFNNKLYFGADDAVYEAFVGYTDNAEIDGSGGEPIVAYALQAFNPFMQELGPGIIKTVSGMKPYITTGASLNPTASVGVNVDFDMSALTGAVQVAPGASALWDAVQWDSGAKWVGVSNTYSSWFHPFAKPGNYLAAAIKVSAQTSVVWSGTDWRLQGGIEM